MPPRSLAGVLLAFHVFAADPHAASSCLQSLPGESAAVVRVQTNGALVLARDREAVLEAILLPSGGRDHASEFYATRAIERLAALATAQRVSLAALPPIKDRYGRIRAQILLENSRHGAWLQELMLNAGLARVSIAPDRRECAQELYAAEARARAARLGIWASPAYRVRANTPLASDIGSFQIVEGKVAAVMKRGGRVFVDFAPRADFAAVISTDDMRKFHRIGVDPFAYEGATVRVRGWVEQIRGRNEIEIATPDAIEVVSPPARK